jgi:hypothetical protein
MWIAMKAIVAHRYNKSNGFLSRFFLKKLLGFARINSGNFLVFKKLKSGGLICTQAVFLLS